MDPEGVPRWIPGQVWRDAEGRYRGKAGLNTHQVTMPYAVPRRLLENCPASQHALPNHTLSNYALPNHGLPNHSLQ